ncbi:MAG: hypothetical protein IPP51_07265 [Bacteroidetes bacterium]|nr:hypothetical protein [Bacteroidota bacterium]
MLRHYIKFPITILFLFLVSQSFALKYNFQGRSIFSNSVFITNDEPCDAAPLVVSHTCSMISADNTGATNSSIPAVACDGDGSGDVWFYATVPPSGHLIIDTQDGTLTDMGMAVYSGACTSPVLTNCEGSGSSSVSTMPYLDLTGLSSGTTIWIGCGM